MREIWIFTRMRVGLAAEQGEEKTLTIDKTYLKANKTAIRMACRNGGVPG